MGLKRIYDRYWKTKGDEIDIKRVERVVGLLKKGSVLDVGCGVGIASAMLMEKGFDVTAVDFSREACKMARKKGVRVLQVDVEEGLPFPDGTFDNVILSEVLEHVYDTDTVLKETLRVLADGGVLVLTVPNIGHWMFRLWLLFGRFPTLEKVQTDSQHIRYFTLHEITSVLGKAGHAVKSIEGFPTLWSPVYDRILGLPLAGKAIRSVYPALCRLRPSLFADKFIIVASQAV